MKLKNNKLSSQLTRPRQPGTYISTLEDLIKYASNCLKDHSNVVHTEKWQGVNIAEKPEMAMHEFLHLNARAGLFGRHDLPYYKDQIKPNLPWADDHFAERVCGEPINPGAEWARWPWGNSADKFRDPVTGRFNHNYMERYWPRYAGMTDKGELRDLVEKENLKAHRGIYHEYGDLLDVVMQLNREPYTRQAILPVWFPEDTGVNHGSRVPCSICYHFIMRNDRMDVFYFLRSCDFLRHFRDDVYLTVRLLLWVLDELGKMNDRWLTVKPGQFHIQITSLHCFRNDYIQLFGAPHE